MTDLSNPSIGHRASPGENAALFKNVSHVDGWIVPSNETVIAEYGDGLDNPPYDAFDLSWFTNSLDVIVQNGEAVVEGAAVARDTTTTITLPDTTNGLTIRLGWSLTTRNSVWVGLSGNEPSNTLSIPIWEVDTDENGVSSVTDLRDIGHRVDSQNNRYETDNGSGTSVDASEVTESIVSGGTQNERYETNNGTGTKVDAAEVADSLAGSATSDFLRSNQNDTMNGRLTFSDSAPRKVLQIDSGTPYDTEVNFYRSSAQYDFALTWNAYWDDGSNIWRSVQGGQSHSIILFDSETPGNIDRDGIIFGAGGTNSNADDAVDWSWTQLEVDGSWNFNGAELKNAKLHTTDSRPSGAENGTIIYRTDKD